MLHLRDRTYVKWLSSNAYSTAQSYSWTKIARQTLVYYQEALVLKEKLLI